MLPNAVFTGDDGADGTPSFTMFPLAETVTFSARVLDGLRGDDAKFLASFPRLRTARFSVRTRWPLDHSTKASTAARSALSFFRPDFVSLRPFGDEGLPGDALPCASWETSGEFSWGDGIRLLCLAAYPSGEFNFEGACLRPSSVRSIGSKLPIIRRLWPMGFPARCRCWTGHRESARR